ncbi:phasin family protein [Azospirillum lipoferum]|uniref:Phasin family protein n=1 Tax=Azospirillum lipoferum TaxID=193 RepID=A0A5A9GR79_AZOLI|nr:MULTISPECIES: phasin family protein [Azospirillum]KAA0597001.1 phasin family protein [Azospirillum lipoferum]MCP1608482.1 phasin family protein [Azospirillum lipoferum]MDW5536198.1 phasin family protein [Azospirillum sp. NL1]
MSDQIAAVTKSVEDAIATAKQNLEGLVKAQQEQIEKASAKVLKGYDELTVLTKENVDALVKSGTVVAKGAEEAGKQVAAFTQSSLEKSVSNAKALLAVKTIQELVELQNAYAKASIDALVSESTKLQELTVKIANEALAPLNARVNATVEVLSKKPVAA